MLDKRCFLSRCGTILLFSYFLPVLPVFSKKGYVPHKCESETRRRKISDLAACRLVRLCGRGAGESAQRFHLQAPGRASSKNPRLSGPARRDCSGARGAGKRGAAFDNQRGRNARGAARFSTAGRAGESIGYDRQNTAGLYDSGLSFHQDLCRYARQRRSFPRIPDGYR